MPKFTLAKPILDEKNEDMIEIVRDKKKMKLNKETGTIEAVPVIDTEGYVVTKPILLSEVIINVLMDHYEDHLTVSGNDRLSRHILAQRILLAGEGEVDLTSDEVTMITDLAAKKRPTLVLGRIKDALKIE